MRINGQLASWIVAWCACASTTIHAVPVDDEEDAQEALEVAERDVTKGKYESARRRLEKIAKGYPKTHAGRLAADRIKPNGLLGWTDVVRHGRSENRVDVVLMGDGYPLKKQNAFDDIAEDVPPVFEHDRVFGEYFSYLNFVKATVVSAEDGIDGYGRAADTALGAHVIPGSLGDHVWVDVHRVKALLNRMEGHDELAIVFVPLGLLGAGGYGVAAVGGRNINMVLHQWGHAFGTLKDEHAVDNGFLGDDKAHWINVSKYESEEKVPWKHWLQARVPGVGVYKGAAGILNGAWKPTASGCRMEVGDDFCVVCREALVLKIHEYVDPIESERVITDPDVEIDWVLGGEEEHEFEIEVLEPDTHKLEVAWYVLPSDDAPRLTGDPSVRPRSKRGKLPPIDAEPEAETRAKNGAHRFRVDPSDLEPGLYRVLVRVRDTSEVRGQRRPWVLSDPNDLLLSERGWWVDVAEPKDS